MAADTWQFWIDVGGTFTDCYARRPDGLVLRHKLLSSGVTKGTASRGGRADELCDVARRRDPPGFWEGYRLRVSLKGQYRDFTVRQFDPGTGSFRLNAPLELDGASALNYELVAGEIAPLVAIRYLLGLKKSDRISPAEVRLGTTRGTNALITRTGARTALITTRGLGDILHIGYQNRPRLFELDIRKPAPLFSAVCEVSERLAADGKVLEPLDAESAREQLRFLKRQGIESLAIALLHAFAHPRHEELLERLAREAGFSHISVSHKAAPLVKLVSRGDTTVVDAYLGPVLDEYLAELASGLPGSRIRLITSAGGVVGADAFTGKDSVLSGPAGGVVGFSQVAAGAGFRKAIGFDMGGTSTDVSRFDNGFQREFETEKAGVRIVTPMLAIETVAAGGGSISRFDGVKLVVGPESAGADPGPACYGRGGPLTITDANLFLGRIVPASFPFPLDRKAVEQRLDELGRQLAAAGVHYTSQQLAEGLLRVANSNMSRAIRRVSVARGYDPRDYVLVPFGGAAGQHACAVARELGIRQVLCHEDAGLLSAYGIGRAEIQRHLVQGVYKLYDPELAAELAGVFEELQRQAGRLLTAEGIEPHEVHTSSTLELRYAGVEAAIEVTADGNRDDHLAAFAREHERLYGYVQASGRVEVVTARVAARGGPQERESASKRLPGSLRRAEHRLPAWFDGRWSEAQIFYRDAIVPGDVIEGPAIVCEKTSTTVIEPSWQASVLSQGELLLERLQSGESASRTPAHDFAEADPVLLEVFNNLLAGIAEQMGLTLRNTAQSVNVKERLDFSCAIFTSAGDLVASAAHIPVHLGAMSQTVQCVIAEFASLEPGDVVVTNDPYRGGSHLPDVTVVTPMHDTRTGELLFFTANRAHHAEIGGMVPGSMPPDAQNLEQEGVLIRPLKLFEAGAARWDALEAILTSGPYPSRTPELNLADIRAQVAANRRGSRELAALVDEYGLPMVQAYMAHIQRAAERKTRMAISRLSDGTRHFVDHLDDGSPIAVSISIAGDRATIDFAGSAPVHPGNLNANYAITSAAVIYALRCLVAGDIPLNQGMLSAVTLLVPPGILNPPSHELAALCPAVVGGNVETSQRIVDVLLGALELAAASQGTMNNVLFGDESFGYYETICGGAGATANCPGADAVHTHMTNTRLTDPEIIERRYGVRVREFAIRRGSGGRGRNPGGCGVVRKLEFLAPLELSILTQRRGAYLPYGLAGGQPGMAGRNTLLGADGREQSLGSQAQLRVEPGDVLVIETPGGGAYGAES